MKKRAGRLCNLSRPIFMNRSDLSRNLKSFGLIKTCQDIALRALNRAVLFKVLKGIKLHRAEPSIINCGDFRALLLNQSMLYRFCEDPQNEMTEEFVEDALSKGDECFGVLDGESLAAYGWYSNSPTAIDPPDLRLHFDRQYIYQYKGFTHARYRGRRLHAVGITGALEHYLARGFKGFIAYVEWNNFASLRSSYRMGFVDFGTIVVTRVFGRLRAHSTAGCKPYNFHLEYAPLTPRTRAAVNITE